MNAPLSRAVSAALELAEALVRTPWRPVAPDGHPRRLFRAIGDPQSTARKFFSILDEHGLLGDNGRLVRNVGLLSIGDHYDFAGEDAAEVGREGQKILRWLAEHPPDQVPIIAGNHDTCRVMELAHASDATWPRARKIGLEHEALRKKRDRTPDEDARLAELRAQFVREFPHVATPGLAARDFMGFAEEQRALVQMLLVERRLVLAVPARTPAGRPMLVTHASVNATDLANLQYDDALEPERLARALNAALARATDEARPAWEKGEDRALHLEPLHFAGKEWQEGGGLLYHRPVNAARANMKKTDYDARAPRRFDARELPEGLLQMCGHTQHKKCLQDLAGWVAPSAEAFIRGGLRTLRGSGDRLVYEAGLIDAGERERALWLIDADMHLVVPDAYPLAPLGGWAAPS